MSDPTPLDRLQPSLLDRLTDDDPSARRESPGASGISISRLRDSVRRELSLLLNATRLDSLVNLDNYPEVADSTLNYGIPDLAGRTASSIDRAMLTRTIREAIATFEPRLVRASLKVDLVVMNGRHDGNAVRIDIEADMWADPLPLRIRWRADLNLEDGEAQLSEAAVGG